MRTRKRLFSIAFTSPAMLVYTCFTVFPIFYCAYLSLTTWNGATPAKFTGLYNFEYLFTRSADFFLVLRNTAYMIGWSLVLQIPLGMILAYLVYRTTRGFRFFRAAIFQPVVISASGIGIMFSLLLNAEVGPITNVARSLGLESIAKMQFLSDANTVLNAVMFPMIWQYIGLYMVLFLAGMQSISTDILESARIDGASSFQIFGRIIIPMCWDVIQITLIWCLTGGLKAFEHSYIMTWGGPGVRSAYLGVFMYRTSFYSSKLGLGSAVAMTILVLSIVISSVIKGICNRVKVYE